MFAKYFYIIICLIMIIVGSCKNNSRTNEPKILGTPEQINNSTESQQEKVLQHEEKAIKHKAIDFFGVKLQGKYEDIVDKIYVLPITFFN